MNPISETHTTSAPCGVTPSRTVSLINWSPSGLGATIQGWRPISVKTQPAALARNGVGMVHTAKRDNHFRSGTRPRRVSHSAVRANSMGIAMNPIIARKDQ